MLTNKTQMGFTLVEVAIVLAIVALLLGGLLIPLATQLEQQRISDTQRTLDNIKEALIGYAIANGRFPCPASSTSNGQESFDVPAGGNATNGKCSNFFNGFVPAVTLGISPTDSQGYAVDAWNTSNNRIRYAVSNRTITNVTPVTNPFTSINGMKSAGMSKIADTSTNYLLWVCASATGITATDCGIALTLTNKAPVVIYSVGKNGSDPAGGTGLDEAANPNPHSTNNDAVFVSHERTPRTAPNGEFDDIMVWMSLGTLFNRMVAAGQLP